MLVDFATCTCTDSSYLHLVTENHSTELVCIDCQLHFIDNYRRSLHTILCTSYSYITVTTIGEFCAETEVKDN